MICKNVILNVYCIKEGVYICNTKDEILSSNPYSFKKYSVSLCVLQLSTKGKNELISRKLQMVIEGFGKKDLLKEVKRMDVIQYEDERLI